MGYPFIMPPEKSVYGKSDKDSILDVIMAGLEKTMRASVSVMVQPTLWNRVPFYDLYRGYYSNMFQAKWEK